MEDVGLFVDVWWHICYHITYNIPKRGGAVLSRIKKLKEKIYSKPIRNDMTFDEIFVLAKEYGCIVEPGGKHSVKIVHKESGTVIPIPRHGDTIREVYIKQLRVLFDQIGSKEEE